MIGSGWRSVVGYCGVWTLLLSFPLLAAAQPVDLNDLLGGGKVGFKKTPKAEFTATLTPSRYQPGDVLTLSVTAKLPKDYYIYGTKGVVKTAITVQTAGVEAVDADFVPDHEGKTLHSPEFNGEVTKFYDTVTWTRKFRALDNAEQVTISGKLEGQYCSEAAVGGQCIQIIPAYQFDVASAVAAVPTAQLASKSDITVRPTRPSSEGERPDPVEFRIRLDPAAAAGGETVTLFVSAKLENGWHMYSLTQSGEGGAPTEIDAVALHNLEALGNGFEADRPYVLEDTAVGQLQTHAGEVTWSRKYRVASAATAGDFGIEGAITYAICDHNSCKPVKSVDFSVGNVPVAVAEDSEPVSPFAAVVEESPVPSAGLAGEKVGNQIAAETLAALDGAETARVERLEDKGLIPFLLLCIGGGFLALLTPCSFPMVPITVSFFLKQSEQEHRRPWLLALVYCGSIVLAFTVLGVGISALFGATKLNELANNPWVNVIIGGVFVAFGLNMLGAFEIRVPTSLLTWSAMHEGGGSYLGAVFMALTFTLTSFTCTFAVAGTLLVSAAKGDVYWPVIGMIAFGAAFASPFFVLAMLPGLLKKLPKSGGWMNSVKVVMGLVEVGAAVKFFSVADLAWNPTPVLFDYATTMILWLILSAAIGAYLMGWYRLSHDTPVNGLSIGRLGLAFGSFFLMALLGHLAMSPDQAQGVIMNQIVAFAPPRLHSVKTDLGPTIEHHGIKFALDLERARPVAQQQGRPLLLDFTGVNCVNCRLMEKKMAQPENRERLDQFVNVQLYADKVPAITNATLADEIKQRNLDLQVNWFGDVSLPSYAVVSPDGKHVLAAYIGLERKQGEFTRFLEYGWKKWEALQAENGPLRAQGIAHR